MKKDIKNIVDSEDAFYTFVCSWSGISKRFTSFKEANKNATIEEAIFFQRKIVGYGKRPANIVQ
jgi:hypothetical protein